MSSQTHFSAKKSLGQNFLTDQAIIEKIISAVNPSSQDIIVEIGPGRGALTERLVVSGAHVISIELDSRLIPLLRRKFSTCPNLSICEGNALDIDLNEIANRHFHRPAGSHISKMKLVANLPYYISTAILQRLAIQREAFSSLILMFQREVVDRILATPGDSDRGYLTVLVESSFLVEKLFDVPPKAFEPQPKVWSSVVRLEPKLNNIGRDEDFRGLLSSAFAHKRKTILNNLKLRYPDAEEILRSAGIDPRRRAETLTLSEWEVLRNFIIERA